MTSPLRAWSFLLGWTVLHSCGEPEPVQPEGVFTITECEWDPRLEGGTVHIEGRRMYILFNDAEANATFAVRYARR